MICTHRRPLGLLLLAVLGVTASGTATAAAPKSFPLKAKRILFLGDSITHAGGYVAWIETQMRLRGVSPLPELINVGLASETCSGLSEPDHPFPRPDVHERLDRALEQVRPDVVVACYGMNDGIYYPFSKKRFAIYQDGVNRLIKKVHASGAKLVLMTPPPFDAVALKGKPGKLRPAGAKKYAWFAIYEDYDREVIAPYGRWILEQKDRVEMVIDLHTPLSAHLAARRKKNPKYTLSTDGVHPNATGQRILGETIAKAWGLPKTIEPGGKLLGLMNQRMSLLHDAWLTSVGHKRPGVKRGLPLKAAQAKARLLDKQIAPLVKDN